MKKPGDLVWRFPVGRHADQQKCDQLEEKDNFVGSEYLDLIRHRWNAGSDLHGVDRKNKHRFIVY